VSVSASRPSPQIPAPALTPSLQASVLVFCGVLASGAFQWQGLHPLRLAAAWLVADAALGCVFSQLVALKLTQARYASTREPGRIVDGPLRIPSAGSPGHRLITTINRYIADWEHHTWPELGRRGVSACIAAALACVLATYLGRWELILISSALALGGLLSLVMGKHAGGLGRLLLALQAGVAVALGYLILAPLNWLAGYLAGMAVIWAYLATTWRQTGARSALQVAGLACVGAVGLLVWARQIIPAAAIAIVGIAQVMGAKEGLPTRAQVHLHRLLWLVSLAWISLASTYWVWPA